VPIFIFNQRDKKIIFLLNFDISYVGFSVYR